MPLFQVRGTMSRNMLDHVAGTPGAAALYQKQLDVLANDLGGTLSDFCVVAGNWELFALFEIPVDGAVSMMPRLQGAGVFATGGFRLAMAMDADQVDELATLSGSIGAIWVGLD